VCERRHRKLLLHRKDRTLHAWGFRCGKCDPCIRRRKREIREESDRAIARATCQNGGGLYTLTVTNAEYAAKKKAAMRCGGSPGGLTIWTPDGLHVITSAPVPGATRVDAAGARAFRDAALKDAVPRGKGRPMVRYWGSWHTPKKKKERKYKILGPTRYTLNAIRKVAEELSVEIELIRPESGGILWKIKFLTTDRGQKRLLLRRLSKSSLGGHAYREEVDRPGPDWPPGDAWEPPGNGLECYDDDFFVDPDPLG
jgi:hypothetical protein